MASKYRVLRSRDVPQTFNRAGDTGRQRGPPGQERKGTAGVPSSGPPAGQAGKPKVVAWSAVRLGAVWAGDSGGESEPFLTIGAFCGPGGLVRCTEIERDLGDIQLTAETKTGNEMGALGLRDVGRRHFQLFEKTLCFGGAFGERGCKLAEDSAWPGGGARTDKHRNRKQ